MEMAAQAICLLLPMQLIQHNAQVAMQKQPHLILREELAVAEVPSVLVETFLAGTLQHSLKVR